MKRKWPVILFILSIVLIAIGLKTGEFQAVLEKARMICLECIGIG
ncbi:MAG: CD1871A family CXXC motif-containing protein [Candidatus Aminicenantales bacterium]